MSKDILMSINPKWWKKIVTGLKTIEVRKRAPLQEHPYKVYVYCTKSGDPIWQAGINRKIDPYVMNGTVCGEFTCVSTTEYEPPLRNIPGGTCLTPKELYEYMGTGEKLCFMAFKDLILYDEPKSLKDFGLKRPPQSWQYIKETECKT